MSLDEKVKCHAEKKVGFNLNDSLFLNFCKKGGICSYYLSMLPAGWYFGLHTINYAFEGGKLSNNPKFHELLNYTSSGALFLFSLGVVLYSGIYENVTYWYKIQDKRKKDMQICYHKKE